jgi:UDP-N-acetyl-D-mannosaminuronate dehydrogenase
MAGNNLGVGNGDRLPFWSLGFLCAVRGAAKEFEEEPADASHEVEHFSKEAKALREQQRVVVVGLGEVGRPLLELISKHHNAIGVDILPPVERIGKVDVLHVCYPFEIKDFVSETVRYIKLFRPTLTIINSTVAIGTTRAVAERTGAAVVHSPVRGKHARMLDELHVYTKFVGAMDPATGKLAAKHFDSVGLKTKILSSPEATELAKLTETTYFGLIIAWAQEVERYCDHSLQNYDEIASFWEEIKFFPSVKYFPGIIGGHCVMSNIELLSKFQYSAILKAIKASNEKKIKRDATVETLTRSRRPREAARATTDGLRNSSVAQPWPGV